MTSTTISNGDDDDDDDDDDKAIRISVFYFLFSYDICLYLVTTCSIKGFNFLLFISFSTSMKKQMLNW